LEAVAFNNCTAFTFSWSGRKGRGRREEGGKGGGRREEEGGGRREEEYHSRIRQVRTPTEVDKISATIKCHFIVRSNFGNNFQFHRVVGKYFSRGFPGDHESLEFLFFLRILR
jgi:hypothetical protein